MTRQATAERLVAERLEKAGFHFERHVSIGGVRPDFLVRGPHDEVVVLEVKSWRMKPGITIHAAEQARLFKEEIGADEALVILVILPNLERSNPSAGVATIDQFIDILTQKVGAPGRHAKRSDRGKRKSKTGLFGEERSKGKQTLVYHAAGESSLEDLAHAKGSKEGHIFKESWAGASNRGSAKETVHKSDFDIFIAMPFAAEYEDVFFGPIASSARAVGGVAHRVDLEEYTGAIIEEVRRHLRQSEVVIVDLSESKPNVLYEAGFAHALEKPTIHICSTSLASLPFDVRNFNTIQYRKGQTYKLRRPLTRRLNAAISSR